MAKKGATGDWDAAIKFMKEAEKRSSSAGRKATDRAAMHFRTIVKKWIRGRAYAPNARSTIKAKGSSLPLVEHGDLRSNITWGKEGKHFAVVGVKRGKTDKETGESLVNIGWALHEGFKTRKGVIVPPRPFLDKPIEDKTVQRALYKKYVDTFKTEFFDKK